MEKALTRMTNFLLVQDGEPIGDIEEQICMLEFRDRSLQAIFDLKAAIAVMEERLNQEDDSCEEFLSALSPAVTAARVLGWELAGWTDFIKGRYRVDLGNATRRSEYEYEIEFA